MLGSILLAALAPAHAGTLVNGGVQAAVYEDGLDFAEDVLNGRDFDIYKYEIWSDPSCYDRVGVRNFNLNIPVDNVNAQLTDNGIYFQVDFDTMTGEDMILFGEDEDFWDPCIGFEKDLHHAQVLDARLEATVIPYISQGELKVEFVGTPLIEGNLDTDTSGFPDEIALWFFEDTLWDKITEASEDLLATAVDTYWQEGLLSGQFHDLDLSADLRDIEVHGDALLAGADVHVDWLGEPVCIPGITDPANDKEPRIDFGNGNGSSVGLGMTEGNLNRLFRDLWEDGYLCFPDDRMDLVYIMVEELFDPTVAGLQAEAIIDTEPTVKITKNGAKVFVDAFSMEVSGRIDDEKIDIIKAEGNLTGKIDLALDPVLTALKVSLHDMDLNLERFEADHLVSDAPSAEEHLRAFIEGWLLDWVIAELEELSLFSTQFDAFGAIARVDDIQWSRDAMLVLASLYHPDDPAVDRVAPDTEIDSLDIRQDTMGALLSFSGSDDRSGDLGYSFRVNGGSWSQWTTDMEVEFSDLLPGTHFFEVKSKDSWMNEDTSPAEVNFELLDNEEDEEDSNRGNLANCSCSSVSPGSTPVLPAGLLLGAMVLLRRRRSE